MPTLSDIHCLVCNSSATNHLLEKTDDGRGKGPVALYECRVCKTVFLASWNDGFIPDLYNYYRARTGMDKSELYDPITESRYEKLLISFKSIVQGNKILDVGSGQGHFVDVAMRYGWDVLGVELSESAVNICKQFGLPAEKVDFFDQVLKPQSFDVITMFEFLEHVASPHRFLIRAQELLKPDGLLYLTTPNFASLGRRSLGANWHIIHREHLVYFTPHTLKALLKRYTPFNILYIRTQNLSSTAIHHLFSRIFKGRGSENVHDNLEHEQAMRQRIESSGVLRLTKRVINYVLNLFDLGESMVVLCRKGR